MKLSIGLLLLRNVALSPFATFVDVLRLAADRGDDSQQRYCTWSVIAPGQSRVVSSCGVELGADSQPIDPVNFDYLVVFGGLLGQEPSLTAEAQRYLQRAAEAGVTLVGVCNGTHALIEAGLMKNLECCVNWFDYQSYRNNFSDVQLISDRIYTEDSNRITCAGGAAAGDLALRLVERHIGAKWARKCQQILMLREMRGTDHPQPLPAEYSHIRDLVVRQTILLIESRLTEELSTSMLARKAGLSRRQLERRFQKAVGTGIREYIVEMRLDMSYDLIVETDRLITDIAYECGFNHHTYFSDVFKRKFGVPPIKIRETRHLQQAAK